MSGIHSLFFDHFFKTECVAKLWIHCKKQRTAGILGLFQINTPFIMIFLTTSVTSKQLKTFGYVIIESHLIQPNVCVYIYFWYMVLTHINYMIYNFGKLFSSNYSTLSAQFCPIWLVTFESIKTPIYSDGGHIHTTSRSCSQLLPKLSKFSPFAWSYIYNTALLRPLPNDTLHGINAEMDGVGWSELPLSRQRWRIRKSC